MTSRRVDEISVPIRIGVPTEPTIDQLIRHLQAELDLVRDIADVQAREQRQWQIESTIQESLAFLRKFRDREKAGMSSILAEKDAVRLIRSAEQEQSESNGNESSKPSTRCPDCGQEMEVGLDFCPSCGEYA